MSKKGFTLVEVLVVVVVAVVVTAFAVPAYKKAQARNKKMAASRVLLELSNAFRSLQADYPDVTFSVVGFNPLGGSSDPTCNYEDKPSSSWSTFAICNNYVRRINIREYGDYTFKVGPNASCSSVSLRCGGSRHIGCMINSTVDVCVSVDQSGLLQGL